MNTYSYLETDTSVSKYKFIHIKNAAYKQTYSVCPQTAFIISLRLYYSATSVSFHKSKLAVLGVVSAGEADWNGSGLDEGLDMVPPSEPAIMVIDSN